VPFEYWHSNVPFFLLLTWFPLLAFDGPQRRRRPCARRSSPMLLMLLLLLLASLLSRSSAGATLLLLLLLLGNGRDQLGEAILLLNLVHKVRRRLAIGG
jgi:hypothetical protein